MLRLGVRLEGVQSATKNAIGAAQAKPTGKIFRVFAQSSGETKRVA